jgi:hypothetical protein
MTTLGSDTQLADSYPDNQSTVDKSVQVLQNYAEDKPQSDKPAHPKRSVFLRISDHSRKKSQITEPG